MPRGQAHAYVLWLGPTGLTIARALARRGVPVTGVHPSPDEPCLATRACRDIKVLPPIDGHEDAWLSFLITRGRTHADRPVLFPAGDAYWMFLARHRARLDPYFRFAMPGGTPEELAAWPSKPFQYAIAARAGVPRPKTLLPETLDEVRRWAGQVDYPCLVKPVYTPQWCRAFKGQGKLACVESAEALIAQAEAAFAAGVPVMLQECVPGGDDRIYGFYAYADRHGEVLAGSVSRKLRQFPPVFGSGSLSRSVERPEIVRLGKRLLHAMRFHGIASVEFKHDPRDGVFRLMEVNLRAPMMMATAVASGVDLPYVAYQDLCEQPLPAIRLRPGRKVVLLEDDWRSGRAYRAAGLLTRRQWLTSLIGARELTFAWDDPMPWLSTMRRAVWRWRQGVYREPVPHEASLPTLRERGWLLGASSS